MAAHASEASFVEVSGVVGVHSGVNSQVFNVVEVFVIEQRIVGGGEHLAHVLRLLAQKRVLLSPHSNITALVAPRVRRVPPLESLLATYIAHATHVE